MGTGVWETVSCTTGRVAEYCRAHSFLKNENWLTRKRVILKEMTERKVAGRYLLQSLVVGISYFLAFNDVTNLIFRFSLVPLCRRSGGCDVAAGP